MGREILFVQEDFVFSYRVGGIVRTKNKILLQKPKDVNYYSVIGGSVSCMETAGKALMRIFDREIHAKIEVQRLFATGEIFFPWEDKPCHQLCLYYEVKITEDSNIPKEGTFHAEDDEGQRRDVEFCWVPLEELGKSAKIYPKEILPFLKKAPKETEHIVSRQI